LLNTIYSHRTNIHVKTTLFDSMHQFCTQHIAVSYAISDTEWIWKSTLEEEVYTYIWLTTIDILQLQRYLFNLYYHKSLFSSFFCF